MAGAGAGGTGGGTGSPVTVSAAAELAAQGDPFWPRLVGHPFVAAVADDTLPDAAFDRWLVQIHAFVAEFRRFQAGLAALAPDEESGDLLGRSVDSLRPELGQFRRCAGARGVPIDAEPPPTTLAYATFQHASLRDGYPVALSVLYATEKSYHDTWAAVRDRASRRSPIWPFLDNWSSPAFGSWVGDVARLVDAGTRRCRWARPRRCAARSSWRCATSCGCSTRSTPARGGEAMAGAGTGGGRGGPVRVSAATELAVLGEPFWPSLVGHPFVAAVADGSLSDGGLAAWLAQGHLFLLAYRRFHAGLLALTTDEDAGDLLGRAVASMRPELAQFRTFAEARGMPVAADATPATLALATFLRASLRNGYPVGLAVLYGTEMSYRTAWTAVRETARERSPVWSFLDNWSSPASGSWLDDLARLVDAAAPMGATRLMRRAFELAVRYQVRLFDAAQTGEGW